MDITEDVWERLRLGLLTRSDTAWALSVIDMVMDLHKPDPRSLITRPSEPTCLGCLTHVTFTPWPCKTVKAMMAVSVLKD